MMRGWRSGDDEKRRGREEGKEVKSFLTAAVDAGTVRGVSPE